MMFARSRKARSNNKRRGKTHKHKYTLKGGDKEKACNQFFRGMNGKGHYDPEEMSLGKHTNLEETDYTSWLTFIPTLNKDNLLLIVLGDKYDTSINYRSRNILKTHNISNDEFIKSWKGKITVLIVDLQNNTDGEIKKSDLDLCGLDDKVEKVFIKQLIFPFTPIPSGTTASQPLYGRSPFRYSILLLN